MLGALVGSARADAEVPVGFLGAITKRQAGAELTEMAELADAGAAGFSDDGVPLVSPGLVRRALQYAAFTGSNGSSLFAGSQKRRKYHDESTNVSIVSVSRRAGPPHVGHLTLTNSGTWASGESPRPVKVVTFGSATGNWSYGTGTTPSLSQ